MRSRIGRFRVTTIMKPGVNDQWNGGVAGSPASPAVHRPDHGLALVLLGVCALLWWDTTQFADVPASLAQNAPPTTFPRPLLRAIALMSLMLPFEHRTKDDGGAGIDNARAQRPQPHVYIPGAVLVPTLPVTPVPCTPLAPLTA